MRPDEHKAKDSRRYQQRKKHQGDATAAEIAEARRRSARARDTGTSIAAIRRRNGELPPPSHANSEKPASSSFSRRKIVSNVDRYKERTLQDELEEDAELGIDRETTNLVAMLDESEETSGNAYFKFKEEQMWDNDAIVQEDIYRSMLEINFDMFEGDLQALDTSTLLDLRSEDKVMVDTALNQVPVLLEKPIVPAFQKNAKGYVLFKSPMVTEIKESPSQHGIYLRNDGSNHRVIPPALAKIENDEKDLDELLALDNSPVQPSADSISTLASSSRNPSKPNTAKPSLKRPGKPVAKTPTVNENDDEAWLDDILG